MKLAACAALFVLLGLFLYVFYMAFDARSHHVPDKF